MSFLRCNIVFPYNRQRQRSTSLIVCDALNDPPKYHGYVSFAKFVAQYFLGCRMSKTGSAHGQKVHEIDFLEFVKLKLSKQEKHVHLNDFQTETHVQNQQK